MIKLQTHTNLLLLQSDDCVVAVYTPQCSFFILCHNIGRCLATYSWYEVYALWLVRKMLRWCEWVPPISNTYVWVFGCTANAYTCVLVIHVCEVWLCKFFFLFFIHTDTNGYGISTEEKKIMFFFFNNYLCLLTTVLLLLLLLFLVYIDLLSSSLLFFCAVLYI